MVNNWKSILLISGGDLNLDTGAYIIFTIIGIAVLIFLNVLLIIRVKKDYYMAKYIGYDKGLMPIERFKIVADRIGKLKTKTLKYGIFRIDIRKYDNIKNAIGEEQIKAVVGEMASIIQNLVPWGIRVCYDKKRSFYVIMVLSEQNSLDNLSKLLINNLSKEYEIGADFNIEIDVNVAAGNIPEAGNCFEELAKSMEITMVISKRQGNNRYVLYNIKYSNEKTPEYQYYQEIREAIEEKEFVLHYQPVVETNNFEVVSAESLIRWAHKTKGLLPPKEFLAIMEQTGDIIWIGEWCVDEMITQLNLWQEKSSKKFTISCNMSEKQLLNPKLFPDLKKSIRKHRVDPSSIVFEIPDIAMYNLSDIVKANIDGLVELGCKIFIDDFGNKFSSPTGLLDLPISGIKVGRNFWKKIETSKIVANIINILVDYSKENGLMLVAVGVESREEMNKLRNIGINYMQGYLFAPQKDAGDFISDVMTIPWSEKLKRKSKHLENDESTDEKPESTTEIEQLDNKQLDTNSTDAEPSNDNTSEE